MGQGVRRHPRRRHGQGRRLRARRRGRRAQDPGVGLQEDRHPRVDHQGAGARVRQAVHLDPALLRRLHGARPVLARARPPRVHPARHAGPRRPRRAPVAVLVLRHAARRVPRELPLLQPVAQRGPAHPGAQQRRRVGHAEHPQDAHPGGHPRRRDPALRRHRRPERRDRGPVHRLPVPGACREGRLAPAHDLDRHAVPHHLLEPRQLDHRGAPRPEHRVHGRAAPLARERLPLRRPHPPRQHHDGGRGHRHQRAPGAAVPDVHAAGEGHRAHRRVHERLRDRDRHRREARPQGRGHLRQDRTTTSRKRSTAT